MFTSKKLKLEITSMIFYACESATAVGSIRHLYKHKKTNATLPQLVVYFLSIINIVININNQIIIPGKFV